MRKQSLLVALALLPIAALGQETPGAAEQTTPQTQQMQSSMQAMHEEMARIHASQDPAERQRLLQEHMQSMHQGMMVMGQMMGPMGMGPRGPTQQCGQADAQCQIGQMQRQQEAMGQRMMMMHQMMGQMMQHMTEQGTSAPAPVPEDGAESDVPKN